MPLRLPLSFCALALWWAAPTRAQTAPPPDGIHVSGSWAITVYEADGSVAQRHAFQNALVEAGAAALARLVSGQAQSGYWVVTVTGPCVGTASEADNNCNLLEVDPATAGWERFGTKFGGLTVSTSEQSEVVLSGTFTPNNSATADVVAVTTQVVTCDVASSGADCVDEASGAYPAPNPAPFTYKQLDAPISVEPGQAVSVEVRIGFN